MALKRLQAKLKEIIRGKKLSYSNLGEQLGVSEATVKRLLNHDDASFSKLNELCDALDMGFFELVELTKDHDQKLYLYTKEQEKFLARSTENFLIFRYLILGYSSDEICIELNLGKKVLSSILKEMEQTELIERHMNDRIRLLANFPFRWIENGPLESKYGPMILKRISSEAAQIGINKVNENSACLIFEWGLSKKNHHNFTSELCALYDKYKKVAEVDIKSLDRNFIPTSGMISIGQYPMW